MIVVPNVICVAGVFTAGFGIWASVVFNNITAVAALANGLWPMRQVAANEKKRRQALSVAAMGEHAEQQQPVATATAPVIDAVESLSNRPAVVEQPDGQPGSKATANGHSANGNATVGCQVSLESTGVVS